ncbi:hypothetical protein [Alicyclobacillus mali (ex Roth et al. 2021)]|uniref:hypothetical protein n=1 Tax=Alicyclobacillus mali (ex Roth et al. 2021) TaxID=1123961 RepID=UPI001A8D0BE6|nr:hypothetical protein [Alicyclobacillus mali (ex Roth et al. 2021)]
MGRTSWTMGAVLACVLSVSGCGTAPWETTSISTTPSTGQAGQGTSVSHGEMGWYFVPIASMYGDMAVIAGIRPGKGRLKLWIRDDRFQGEGVTFAKTWDVAWFTPATGVLTRAGTMPSRAQSRYNGSVQLVFPYQWPTGGHPVEVSVRMGTRPGPPWPAAIPMYGSDMTPASFAPGAWDNLILGQVGDWVWVALKGPESPPLPGGTFATLWGYRTWDRLVAFNTKTGQAVQYPILRSYSIGSYIEMVTPNLTVPSFAVQGDRVDVGVGEWIGSFPAKPSIPAHADVLRIQAPIIHVPDSAYVESTGQAALDALNLDVELAAQSLASYWDSLVGVSVPGLPPFSEYRTGKLLAWNLYPTLVNHGSLPPDMLWSLMFPYPAKSSVDAERNELAEEVVAIMQSPLDWDAENMGAISARDVIARFHHRPPMALPGYVVRGDAYWPKG